MEPFLLILLIVLATIALVVSAFVAYAGLLAVWRRRRRQGRGPRPGDEPDDTVRPRAGEEFRGRP
jgi:hypothetical protein